MDLFSLAFGAWLPCVSCKYHFQVIGCEDTEIWPLCDDLRRFILYCFMRVID